MGEPLFAPVFSALDGAEARYVVVGGLAVVLHGHPRLTADADIVLDLDPVAARRAMEALESIGLKARAPVDMKAFADPKQRQAWIETKGLTVFSLFSPKNPLLILDVFVRDPLPFEGLWKRAVIMELEGVPVRVASIDDLIEMKKAAARPQDLQDIEALLELRRGRGEGPRG